MLDEQCSTDVTVLPFFFSVLNCKRQYEIPPLLPYTSILFAGLKDRGGISNSSDQNEIFSFNAGATLRQSAIPQLVLYGFGTDIHVPQRMKPVDVLPQFH